ncbi:hypothetical protein WR25_01332 [Diploscapter pachys]|uniref:Uncharacterized protein n=1 Tax=Diploscapter pachys TaxID=2018661 RepID=A0A2A2JAC1_9BILA|nr:hypothetical protein WR25_01332 [Diploscapter pachys]
MSTHNLDSVDGLDLDRYFAYKDCGILEGFDGVSTADEISFIGTNCVVDGMRSLRLSESTNSTVQPADVKGGSFYVHETQQSGQAGQSVEADCETENEQGEGKAAHRIPSYYHLEEMNKTPVVRMVRLAAVPSQYQLDCLSEVFFLDAPVLKYVRGADSEYVTPMTFY